MSKITVYTKNGCPQCDMTKVVLNEKEVTYEVINVEEDDQAYNYVQNDLGYTSMPVVVVEGEEPFSGFRPDKLHQIKG
jgi:glutaredoxin-like protein NrdH